jgi:hypothetical protein
LAELPRPERDGGERVEPARDDAHERARKIDPVYAEGELVRVGWAANQAEAELIQGLLLEHGVPSTLGRSMGFDVPDFLAAGPRDVLVPAGGAAVARELLGDSGTTADAAAADGPRLAQGLRIGTVLVLVGGGLALLVWLAQSGG